MKLYRITYGYYDGTFENLGNYSESDYTYLSDESRIEDDALLFNSLVDVVSESYDFKSIPRTDENKQFYLDEWDDNNFKEWDNINFKNMYYISLLNEQVNSLTKYFSMWDLIDFINENTLLRIDISKDVQGYDYRGMWEV